jgi:hypothetical protein
MNAPYRDQSIKVIVHFAPRKDGGLMVWSEHWRGLTRSTEQSASTPAVPLRFGKKTCSAARCTGGAVAAGICGEGGLRGGSHGLGPLGAPKPARDRAGRCCRYQVAVSCGARGQRQLRSRFVISSVG